MKDAPEVMPENQEAKRVISMLLASPNQTYSGYYVLDHTACFTLCDRYKIQSPLIVHDKAMRVFEILNQRHSEKVEQQNKKQQGPALPRLTEKKHSWKN